MSNINVIATFTLVTGRGRKSMGVPSAQRVLVNQSKKWQAGLPAAMFVVGQWSGGSAGSRLGDQPVTAAAR